MIINVLYNIAISLFVLVIRISSVYNDKAKQWISGRKHQFQLLKEAFNQEERPIWIHCASLGEFEQGRPLIEEIRTQFPSKKIILTFFSPSGYEVRKNYSQVDWVFYLPSDRFFNARKFIKIVQPEMAIFVKYEFWRNYLVQLKNNNIPIYFISSIFRPDQLFFKKYGGWYRKILTNISHIFVQNETSKKLLNSIGIQQVTVSGDTRFDRVAKVVNFAKHIDLVERFCNGEKLVVAGSTWKAEEAMLVQYFRNRPSERLIIAPHEVNDEHIAHIENLFGERSICFSKASIENLHDKQVLIIDSYGMLTSLYQYGKIAIIGGGFGVGIHNVLEAATFGMPILFGSNYERFQEAVDLVKEQCAFSVQNIEEFNAILNRLLSDDETRQKIAIKTAKYVLQNTGATDTILHTIFSK